MGRFEATCSHFENLGLKIGEYRLSDSDICDGKCEFRVFPHCSCHPRSKPKLESLSLFIKRLRAIAFNGSLINVRDLKGPPSAGGVT